MKIIKGVGGFIYIVVLTICYLIAGLGVFLWSTVRDIFKGE
jgi:hypothetical protein